MISVREAKPGDGEALVTMARALAEAHGMGETFALTPEALEKDLFSPHAIIGALIAHVDGVPAGSAIWHRSYSTNRGGEVMYLEDLSVLESFRRRGVAKALIKACAGVAVRRGYRFMYWSVMEWNAGARQLYSSLGASEESGFITCRLKDDALKAVAE